MIHAVRPTWRDAAGGEPRLAYHLAAVADDQLVGLGALTVTSPAHRRGEVGYVVHPDRWGKGLGNDR
ncbi:GNAT family N-acetyltransferase [Micromonospora sp. NPDC006766]|uniref:GNAT family N-acetyltransferase n=1 Tax=Micromonospora sp. NPDC006766 TaxID=3154778 RepID=UPI0033CD3EC0